MPTADIDWPRADVWLSREDDEPEVLIVGVPSSKASHPPARADLAPMAVRDRLSRFSTFHGELGFDFAAMRVRDVGNWAVSELDMFQMPEVVEGLARSLPDVPLRLYLGGDNAITRPLVASLGDPSRVGIVTFDARHDVHSLDNGPHNGTPIRGLIEEHGVSGSNIVQIGIHPFANSSSCRAYSEGAGIGVFTVSDVEDRGMNDVVGEAFERLGHCDRVYVAVDLGVLDRAFAPGCRGARPGGLTLRRLADGVVLCASNRKTRAMDIVEVDPALDVSEITLDAAAHVLLSAVAGFGRR